MRRRMGLLVAAIVVALFGTTAVFAYVHRAEARVLRANDPVNVLVASLRLPTGTTGGAIAANKWAHVVQVPRKSVPVGALSELTAVEGKQLVADVYPGEMLLDPKFVVAQQAQTGALTIPAGKLAVSVQLDDPERVAGFVVPGSEVAVFDTSGGSGGSGGAGGGVYTGVILPRVQVIAVGPTALQSNGQTGAGQQQVPATILTLAVDQSEAEKLVLAQQTGKLYFGLLSDRSHVTTDGGLSVDALYH